MPAGARGVLITPGTAAALSLPWNHRVSVSHHLRSVIKAQRWQLESKKIGSPKGTGVSPAECLLYKGQRSVVSTHCKLMLATSPSCGPALVLTAAATQTFYSSPLSNLTQAGVRRCLLESAWEGPRAQGMRLSHGSKLK